MGENNEEEQGVSIQIPRKWAATMLTVVLAGIFGGISSPIVNMATDVRYDSFTRSDFDREKAVLVKQITDLEKRVIILETTHRNQQKI